MSSVKYIDFAQLRNAHVGKTALFFASGVTLNDYVDVDLPSCIRVGVNAVAFASNVGQLDYYFIGDASHAILRAQKDELDSFTPRLGKFIGRDERAKLDIPTHFPDSVMNALHYETKLRAPFAANLTKAPVGRWGSISFDAAQVIAWTGVSRMVLVGHDCDYSNGSFNMNRGIGAGTAKKLQNHWALMKKFFTEHYPELEILSVNPVGLKIFPSISIEELQDMLINEG